MNTLKEEPYLAILAVCFIIILIAIAIEYIDVVAALIGGAAVIFLTTVLPIGLLALTIQGIARLVRKSRKR